LVYGGVEAELRQVERRRLQGQRHVDLGVALVDRETDVHMRHDLRAEAEYAAGGAALVTDNIALTVGPDREPVELAPAPVTRPLNGLGCTAAGWVVAQAAVETVGRLVAEPLQE